MCNLRVLSDFDLCSGLVMLYVFRRTLAQNLQVGNNVLRVRVPAFTVVGLKQMKECRGMVSSLFEQGASMVNIV